ncbi:tetratricopeptide repeat protein [Nocardiopsis sp. NPDC006198]|uniref:tetratricopeptide repeat protein n=1 Tax=Nocardiopsis sp. NPDC006198 TaxID=3154472 RepID=UPI0033BF039A
MLTAAHITRIATPTGTGSGCVIASHLLLTSAHVVPPPGGEVSFFTATDARVHTGRVTWRGTPGGMDDAALVEITDPGWAPPPLRTRWGRLVTNRPGTPCHTWGYPDLVQRQGRPVETAQPSGTLNPGDRMIGHRYVMNISGHPPQWDRDGSPWGGLSGAALMCDDLVTGVVATDPDHRAHAAVEAVPAYILHHDPGFRAVLADHGVPLALEPVELAHLAHTARAHHRPSPASLLEAHRQVVDFHGRDEVMGTLIGWCASDEALSAVVVHGPGGQGKTRLAHELTSHLTHSDTHGQRWATVWLKDNATARDLEPLKDTAAPLLVVVDYAETRTAQLVPLLQLCDRPPGASPVRVLLLVRTVGEWWEQVNTVTGHLLADTARRLPLPPLVPHVLDRVQEYRTALHQLAEALPEARTPHPADWTGAADDLHDPDLAGPTWDTVLSVHMRALADLLDATQPTTAITTDSAVEGRVLAHEYRYWNHTAAAHGLGGAELAQPLRDVLALAFVLAPADTEEADHLLADAAVLEGQTAARRHQIRRWTSGLYPTDGAGPWGQLQPDRLLEYFLGQRLEANPTLFDPHLEGITPADAERLVTLYTRAAAHPALPSVGGHLTRLCARHVKLLGSAVIEVATQVESPGPLIQALEETTDAPDTSAEVIEQLSNALPRSSQRLAVWAERLTAHLVEVCRERAAQDPDAHLPDLATSLNSQSNRLVDLGRVEEALEVIVEAVRIRRVLVEQGSGTYLHDLATSLNNQSNCLGDLGRVEEALEVIAEAVRIHRTLAEQRPDTYLLNLATSLHNQAVRLSALDRTEEALEVIVEAVRIHRTLIEQHPDIYLLNLAAYLHTQSVLLAALGRTEEALEVIVEAVRVRRTLAEQHPDAYLPDLAGSLHNQSVDLAVLGRTEEALEAIIEAVRINRALAEQHPDTHLSDLAESLNNQAVRLADLGRVEDALEAITEAVQHYHVLAEQRPDAYLPDLAESLNNRSIHLGVLGRTEEALEAITEVVRINRALAEQHPDTYLPGLAGSLHNQSVDLDALGRTEEALEAITEVVRIRRVLAEQHPDTHLSDLAESLNNQAVRLADLGRVEEALEAGTEVVGINRTLAEQRPDAYLPDLAGFLHNRSNFLAILGRAEEALEASTEVVLIRRGLAEQRPDVYLSDLAESLNNQSIHLAALGRAEEAVEAITEAVRVNRVLAEQSPGDYLPDLATSLNNQSVDLGTLGRVEEALEASTEVVGINRTLVEQSPGDYLPDLAGSLHNRSNFLAILSRVEEALEASTEAVQCYQILAEQSPDAYLSDLAESLNNQSIHLAALGRAEEALEASTEVVRIRRALAE